MHANEIAANGGDHRISYHMYVLSIASPHDGTTHHQYGHCFMWYRQCQNSAVLQVLRNHWSCVMDQQQSDVCSFVFVLCRLCKNMTQQSIHRPKRFTNLLSFLENVSSASMRSAFRKRFHDFHMVNFFAGWCSHCQVLCLRVVTSRVLVRPGA